ncbi:MAG: hypothetical protein ACT4NT_05400 [Nitrososphaerota archaeon]
MKSFPALTDGIFIILLYGQIMIAKNLSVVPKSKKSITLEKEIETKVRKIQARLIEKTNQNWSLSAVLNILVTAGLYQTKKITKNDWQKVREAVDSKTIHFDDSMILDFIKKIT